MFLFQLFTVMLTALAAALAASHAFEMPGKRRLSREDYFKVQKIYYPGFTIGGIGEVAAVFATAVLALASLNTGVFFLTLFAFACMAAMQAIYWLVTHPVNRVWMSGEQVSGAAAGFFASGLKSLDTHADWKALRDRWEYSHVVRAGLGAASLLALVAAIGLR